MDRGVLLAAALLALLAAAVAAAGCGGLLLAARHELRARADLARHLAWRGGLAMILAVPALITATIVVAASPPIRDALLGPRRDPAAASALALFSVLGIASAFSGFLAGLSGKPRTAGRVASVLFAIALACWGFALARFWSASGA